MDGDEQVHGAGVKLDVSQLERQARWLNLALSLKHLAHERHRGHVELAGQPNQRAVPLTYHRGHRPDPVTVVGRSMLLVPSFQAPSHLLGRCAARF